MAFISSLNDFHNNFVEFPYFSNHINPIEVQHSTSDYSQRDNPYNHFQYEEPFEPNFNYFP